MLLITKRYHFKHLKVSHKLFSKKVLYKEEYIEMNDLSALMFVIAILQFNVGQVLTVLGLYKEKKNLTRTGLSVILFSILWGILGSLSHLLWKG